MSYDNTKKTELQEENLREIQAVKSRWIRDEEIVKMTIQGRDYVDVLVGCHGGATVKKLSKTEYMVLSTGEIKYYKEKEDKKQKENIRKAFNRLRQLIRANFTSGAKNQLFITLTYAENMQDVEKLARDFDNFMKRLKRKMKGHKLDYIAVIEPQDRGSWHVHLLLKTDRKVLYIDNRDMAEVWGHGYTDTQRLKSDDVGSYYVAYFTDILDKDNENSNSKKREKGARLALYPKNFKFYRTSRGIKKPIKIEEEYGKLRKAGFRKTYIRAFQIVDSVSGNVLSKIQKETWKRIRSKNKGKGNKADNECEKGKGDIKGEVALNAGVNAVGKGEGWGYERQDSTRILE